MFGLKKMFQKISKTKSIYIYDNQHAFIIHFKNKKQIEITPAQFLFKKNGELKALLVENKINIV